MKKPWPSEACDCSRNAAGWCGAKNASVPTRMPTPAMWTQAERSLSRATSRTPRWLSTAWLTRIAAQIASVRGRSVKPSMAATNSASP